MDVRKLLISVVEGIIKIVHCTHSSREWQNLRFLALSKLTRSLR
jgi:hypothetical protein